MQPQKHPFNQQFLQNNSTNTTNPPINPQQVLAANPGLANLCNAILANSMQMQMPHPQPQIPFNNFMSQQQQSSFCNPQMQMGFNYTPQNNNMFVNPQMGFNYSTFPPYAFPNMNMNMNPLQLPNRQNPNFFFNTNANANTALPFPISHQLNPNRLSQLDSFKHKDNPVHNGQNNTSSSSWKRLSNEEYKKNPKQESSKFSNKKSRSHHMNNGKRKFGEHKGHGHERATKFGDTIPTELAKERKRSLALIYTEQEIKQWREERKKNFPSKANVEKKCGINLSNSEVLDKEAKLRREQLKEILAKQAELGVEVAEIPSEYLSDSEKIVKKKEDNQRSNFKKGRFRHKNNKRGKWNKKNRTVEQNMLGENDSPNISSFDITKRKPTLLQKLLSPEVRKDKEHLLQVFRFMIVNSFFEKWPEKPLKYPSVVVKEDEVVSEKSRSAGKCDSGIGNKTTVENFGHIHDSDGNDDSTDDDKYDKHEADRIEEEEGEIIN